MSKTVFLTDLVLCYSFSSKTDRLDLILKCSQNVDVSLGKKDKLIKYPYAVCAGKIKAYDIEFVSILFKIVSLNQFKSYQITQIRSCLYEVTS